MDRSLSSPLEKIPGRGRPEARILPFLCVFALLWIVAGCGAKQNLFILVPDPDGKVGSITVSNPEGSITLTEASDATEIKGKGKAPEASFSMEEKEIEEIFGPVLDIQPVPPAHFLLYFLSDSTELDEPSKAEIPRILDTIRERKSVDISIIGHSDTVGKDEYNYRLSLDRARAVGGILMAEGVLEKHLQVTSHGEKNLLVPTPDNVEESRNRRVEVIVR